MNKKRIIFWLIHICILVCFCFLDAPIENRLVYTVNQISQVPTIPIEIVKGSKGATATINFTEGEKTITHNIKPNTEERSYILIKTKHELHGNAIWQEHFFSDNFWQCFESFGVVYTSIAILAFIWIQDPTRRRQIILFIICAAATGTAVWFLQHAVGKTRPNCINPTLSFLRFPLGFKKMASFSFPSGHTTYAFTLATFLAFLYPKTRFLLYTIAALTGISRVLYFHHWSSDVYAAALIGYGLTRLICTTSKTWLHKPDKTE